MVAQDEGEFPVDDVVSICHVDMKGQMSITLIRTVKIPSEAQAGGMQMPKRLTPAEAEEIQKRYAYLTNDDSDDPSSPIDPLIYRDSNGDHLLHIASQRGDLRTVQLLVNAGVWIDQRGDMDCTALHYARMNGHNDLSEFLVRHGASQTLRNAFGRPPGER